MNTRLDDRKIAALKKASIWLFRSDYFPYLELKELRKIEGDFSQRRFRYLFKQFYGFDQMRLTNDEQTMFEANFFRMLDSKVTSIATVLNSLRVVNKKCHYSHASKLISFNDESSPIFDTHVRSFFGVSRPTSKLPVNRLTRFTEILECIRTSYQDWTEGEQTQKILDDLKARHPELEGCHPNRLWDFLVWNVGNKGFLNEDLNERS